MGINVSVCGADKESDEYKAALKLKKIIQDTTPDNANGEIVLFASATLYGQSVKDVDIMMLGDLHNYPVNADFYDEKCEAVSDKVFIQTFCTVIEIKRHDTSGIIVNGTDIYVKYSSGPKCVTLQSNKQKLAAKDFFESTLTISPFITNIIWFTQVMPDDINAILSGGGKKMPSNLIGSDFEFKDLMRLLILQNTPAWNGKNYYYDSKYKNCSIESFRKALMLFAETKEHMGELTRKRIEMITNKSFRDKGLIDAQGKVSIYRGRAGTGKTVGLIQTAISLVDEQSARVLILTYNKALVSDVRRLFALADLPDMFEVNCVSVNTLQSYFYKLSNKVLYEGKMSGDKFLEYYDKIIQELNDFLKDSDDVQLIKEEIKGDELLDWDYLLIDEAQDWLDAERDIVLKLFDHGNIIVADGGNQFVRRGKVCDWNVIHDRTNIKLKYCLRQKSNIIGFLNVLSNDMGMTGGKIIASDNMLGGKVRIIATEDVFDVHDEEMDLLRKNENIPYDMLYLVPHSLVRKSGDDAHFSMTDEFEDRGIFFWDGTSSRNRESYSIKGDEVRLLQYDSARGLEGWTVLCIDFDVFMQEKESEYVDGEVDSLLLESPEERKKKFLYNWLMIPLTRAIDTLVITLKDPGSEWGRLLEKVSQECEDYVSFL